MVLGAAIPAWLLMRVVERPIRFSPTIQLRTSSGIAVGVISMCAALIATLGIGTRAILDLGGVSAYADVPPLVSVFGKGAGPTAGRVTPSPLAARADRPYPDRCIVPGTVSVSPPNCEFGPRNGLPVILFGDSHAQQWQPALQVLAAKLGWHVHLLTKAGCPVPAIAPRGHGGSLLSMPQCLAWRAGSLRRITEQLHPALIVVSSLWAYRLPQDVLLNDWNTTLNALREAHAPIVYIVDTPFPGTDIPACMSSSLDRWAHCAFPRSRALTTDPVELASISGREPGVHVVNLTNYLCPQPMCPAARDHVLFYRDDSHITATLSKLLAPALERAMIASKALRPNGSIRYSERH